MRSYPNIFLYPRPLIRNFSSPLNLLSSVLQAARDACVAKLEGKNPGSQWDVSDDEEERDDDDDDECYQNFNQYHSARYKRWKASRSKAGRPTKKKKKDKLKKPQRYYH